MDPKFLRRFSRRMKTDALSSFVALEFRILRNCLDSATSF
jgi:hypothetical protein